jgi:hypothetical protein
MWARGNLNGAKTTLSNQGTENPEVCNAAEKRQAKYEGVEALTRTISQKR